MKSSLFNTHTMSMLGNTHNAQLQKTQRKFTDASRLVWALLGNVTRLATVVASLGRSVTGSGTVLGDVASLTTSVTLDNTSLTVSGKVVWTTALVAGSTRGLVATNSWGVRSLWLVVGTLWAALRDVTELTAVVALGTLGLSWALRLDVTNVTTRVALLVGGLLWLWALSRLVTRLTAVVAQSLARLTGLGQVTDLTTLVTGSNETSHFRKLVV